MSTLLEDLRKYFRETPRDKIMKDWALSEKYDGIGPIAEEFIEISKCYSPIEVPDSVMKSQPSINNINNPKFTHFGFIL